MSKTEMQSDIKYFKTIKSTVAIIYLIDRVFFLMLGQNLARYYFCLDDYGYYYDYYNYYYYYSACFAKIPWWSPIRELATQALA